MRILLVEDNETSAMVVGGVLSNNGHETVRVHNGCEALEKLSSDAAFELILSDIAMPEMDGLTLLKTLREDPHFCDIPVIMCTALADAEKVKEAIRLGCADYVVKPIHANSLLAKIQKVVTKVRAIISSKSEISRRYDLDKSAYDKIINSFRDLLVEQVALLEHQTESSKAEAVAPDLCQLQESATVFGADRLLCILNQLLIHKETTPDYTGLLAQIKLVLQALPSRATQDGPPDKGDGEASEPENGDKK